MPYCRICRNKHRFGSSQVPPVAPTANGPVSGLLGDFDGAGNLLSVTRLGADKATATAAGREPQSYFDVCPNCGSQDITWQ